MITGEARGLQRQFLTTAERRTVTKRFSMTLANLIEAAIYWSPRRRCVLARRRRASRGRALPSDAIYVGTYSHPFTCTDFVSDLEDVLSALAGPQGRPQPSAVSAEQLQA